MDEKIKLATELSSEFIAPCNTCKIKKLGRERFL